MTPVHCRESRNAEGRTRWIVLPGGYCDKPSRERFESKLRPGYALTENGSWRADLSQIEHPGNAEPNYTAGVN